MMLSAGCLRFISAGIVGILFAAIPACTIADFSEDACNDEGEVITTSSGTFGVYSASHTYSPSLFCSWRIGNSNRTNVVAISFEAFETECSWDAVKIWDAPDAQKPQLLADLSGYIFDTSLEKSVFYSKSSRIIVEFSSDESVQGSGFIARFEILPVCWSNCSSHGTCVDKTCQCSEGYQGVFCDKVLDFAKPMPRYQAAIAETLDQSSLIISGGRNVSGVFSWDLSKYNLEMKNWTKFSTAGLGKPLGTYEHKLFYIDGILHAAGYSAEVIAVFKIWRLDSKLQEWSVISDRKRTGSPPQMAGTTILPIPSRKVVYVLGGFFGSSPSSFQVSTDVYCFDFDKNSWHEINRLPGMARTRYSVFMSPAIYRPESGFIHVFGPFYLYSYHIDSKLWYMETYAAGPMSSIPRFKNSADLLDDGNTVALTGGQLWPYSNDGVDKTCLLNEVIYFDLDCRTSSIAIGENSTLKINKELYRRYQHSTFAKDSKLYMYGGRNFKDLDDLVTVNLTATFVDEQKRKVCRTTTWCSLSNDCDDCVMKKGCGWCNDECGYECKNDSQECPKRVVLYLDEKYTGTLGGNEKQMYKIYINNPDDDIYYCFSLYDYVDFTMISIRSKTRYRFNARCTRVLKGSKYSMPGWTLLEAANHINVAVNIIIFISTENPAAATSNNDTIAAAISLVIAFLSFAASIYMISRRLRSVSRDSTSGSRPKVPSPIYSVDAQVLLRLKLKSPHFGTLRTSPLSPSVSPESFNSMDRNFSPLLSTDGEILLKPLIRSEGPAILTLAPLSAESVQLSGSSFIYLTFIVRMPGCSNRDVSSGAVLSSFCFATTLFRLEITTRERERHENICRLQRESLQLRPSRFQKIIGFFPSLFKRFRMRMRMRSSARRHDAIELSSPLSSPSPVILTPIQT